MRKNMLKTPRSRITSALRRLWLYSRERAYAVKQGRRCSMCGSKDKLEVHHVKPADMDRIVDTIYEELLIGSEGLNVLCRTCHRKTHEG
jgi:5-methylcytosine-specific restriction endonuclease McrA